MLIILIVKLRDTMIEEVFLFPSNFFPKNWRKHEEKSKPA